MTDNPFPVRAEQPSDFYVYGYFEPGSDEPFYIGKGRGKRDRCHLGAFKKSTWGGLFYIRLRELDAKGITPDVRKLHEGMTESDAFDREIDFIEQWGRIDIGTGCLCNHTRGGDGSSDPSPEARARMSRSRTGKKHSAETREKLRRAQTGKKHTAETRAKMSRVRTGDTRRKPSAETRAKLSRARTGKPGKRPSIKTREKMSRARGGRPVESFDLTTGQTNKVYPILCLTADDGFDRSKVLRICKGLRKSHHGLGWRYAA